MKKKIFLVLAIMAMLVCAFAISVSASITTYDDAPTRTILEMNDDEYVVFADGFCCPTYYILPDNAKLEKTDYTYINGKRGKTYTDADVVEMHVSTGITDMNKRFGAWKIFTNCTVVGVPSTATVADQFGTSSIVTKVYLPDEHTSIPAWGFSGSTALEEIIISENSKLEVIYGGAFQSCNSLKYLYLPKGFKHFDNTNGNEPFKNFNPTHDNFGFINSPDETTIPEVYFFPESFEYTENFLWGSRIRNYAIVLPESVTAITGKYDLDNAFVTCVVLLSDEVTTVNLWNTTNGSKIYLPNMSSDDLNGDFFAQNASSVVSTSSGKTFTHQTRKGGLQYYYFGVDGKYTHTTWSNSMQKGGLNPFQSMSEADHLNAYTNVISADCTNDAKTVATCVCGYEKAPTVKTGTALGHSHTVLVDVIYASFQEEGYYSYKCERCEDLDNTKSVPALFTCLGYSAPMSDEKTGIAIGFAINKEAIEEYEATGKSISFGVYAVAQQKLGENDIFDENGNATAGVINADLTSYSVDAFEIKIVGFADTQKDIKLSMGAYVTEDGKTYSYLQSDKAGELVGSYYAVTYNSVIASLEANESK